MVEVIGGHVGFDRLDISASSDIQMLANEALSGAWVLSGRDKLIIHWISLRTSPNENKIS